jgi:ketosteroid isomerase-like protein
VSQENVKLLRRLYEAFNARDIERMLEYFHPSIEFHSTFTVVGGALYHGHDGLRRWHRDLGEAWGDEIRLEPEAYFDLGERTASFHVLRGRGRESGVEVGMPIAQVVRWREDLVVYLKSYAHREDALSDLGVSSDELEPIDP